MFYFSLSEAALSPEGGFVYSHVANNGVAGVLLLS
jgi:hypothetical protein